MLLVEPQVVAEDGEPPFVLGPGVVLYCTVLYCTVLYCTALYLVWYCFPNWPRNLANCSASSASEARLADTKAAATRRNFMVTDTS